MWAATLHHPKRYHNCEVSEDLKRPSCNASTRNVPSIFSPNQEDFCEFWSYVGCVDFGTGIFSLKPPLMPDSEVLSPLKSCLLGCSRFWCLCHGPRHLFLSHEASDEHIQSAVYRQSFGCNLDITYQCWDFLSITWPSIRVDQAIFAKLHDLCREFILESSFLSPEPFVLLDAQRKLSPLISFAFFRWSTWSLLQAVRARNLEHWIPSSRPWRVFRLLCLWILEFCTTYI